MTIAVRTLVEQLLRSGDLRVDFFGGARALEGMRIHQQVQRRRPPDYQAELTVSHRFETGEVTLCVVGRIDGLFSQDDRYVIEEIKSTRRPLDELVEQDDPVHWGQAQCYAYMWAVEHAVTTLNVQLTYVHASSGEIRELVRTFELQELTAFFNALMDRYHVWLLGMVRRAALRDQSIDRVAFPFADYRPGQRDLAVAVYRCIRDGGHLMVQAATGIGKTMAVMFPAVKALGERQATRIVYLTARSTGRLAAETALAVLRDSGLRLKAISLTAKEKICFEPEKACLPEACAYARGFYDRINPAIEAALQIDALTREALVAVARQYQVCPFELSLELIQWVDCVIGDYNYAFDPRVTLQRIFGDEGGSVIVLVDEAHNLVDRGREMFSAVLDKQAMLVFRRKIKKDLPQLYRHLGRINAWLAGQRRRVADAGGSVAMKTAPLDMVERLQVFARVAEAWLSKNIQTDFRETLLALYFDCIRFIRVAEGYDERFATIYTSTGADLTVKLFCMDPSVQLQDAWQRCKAAVLFSATLTPVDYFQDLLGCDRAAARLKLASPFPPANLMVLAALNISTYYQHRLDSCHAVSRMIGAFVSRHQGHYLVFFPSYAYLKMVRQAFADAFGEIELLTQTAEMDDGDKEAFLRRFQQGVVRTLVGFAVMGGVFGEGIDLKGDRLTGAVVVGVGLPAICLERDLIRKFFDRRNGHGFAYAYQFPGINRVLQAAGRVIRSESDRGVVLLIDQRYARSAYRSLLPSDWRLQKTALAAEIDKALADFWKV